MGFDFSRFFFPFLFYIAAVLAVLYLFPMEAYSQTRIYNYATKMNEMKKEPNMTPILILVFLSIGMFAYFCMTPDMDDSINRTFENVLYDHACRNQLSHYNIYSPFKIVHEHELGDWPQGTVGIGTVINSDNKFVYLAYLANNDYRTTRLRQRRFSPIMAIDHNAAHVEDFIRANMPKMRQPEERLLERAFKALKNAPEEKREYYEQRSKKEEEERDDV